MALQAGTLARTVDVTSRIIELRGVAPFLLPQRVAVIGQGTFDSAYALEPTPITSAAQAGAAFGFGSPIALAAEQLFPVNGDGLGQIPCTAYPLVQGTGEKLLLVTNTGTQTQEGVYRAVVNGMRSLPFVLEVGDTAFRAQERMIDAINGVLNMPVNAQVFPASSNVILRVRWEGFSGSYVRFEIEGEQHGVVMSGADPGFAGTDPDVQPALDLIGADVWETLIVNCLSFDNEAAIDAYRAFGDLRVGRQPVMVFTGTSLDRTETDYIPATRKSDRINGFASALGSANLDMQIAARVVARIALIANSDPARDYGRQELTGIAPNTLLDVRPNPFILSSSLSNPSPMRRVARFTLFDMRLTGADILSTPRKIVSMTKRLAMPGHQRRPEPVIEPTDALHAHVGDRGE